MVRVGIAIDGLMFRSRWTPFLNDQDKDKDKKAQNYIKTIKIKIKKAQNYKNYIQMFRSRWTPF